jgi:hypothetical protein
MMPIAKGWLGKMDEAIDARRGFDDVAEQCHSFFAGDMGFMWDSNFQKKYMKGGMDPKFKITLQKGYELVSIFGPKMYHQNPTREVRDVEPLEFSPMAFGDPNDPQVQQIFQMAQQQQQQRAEDDSIRNKLFDIILNYTPGEMPGGGLAAHSKQGITEALVTGRGVLWPRDYHMPGSDRTLTGCFWDSQDNLFYDPDATSVDDAWWVARREIKPYWEFEREFNLPKDSLRGKATHESRNSRGDSAGDDLAAHHRREGKTNDLMVVYKIWSKMGLGGRMKGNMEHVSDGLRKELDEVCGDYCYICVAEGVDFPLNAPSEAVVKEDDDQIEKRFRWPIPFWRDDKWPFALLEFNKNPKSPYPIAPMAPGLGELTYLNIFISHLAARTWSSSRDLIVVLERAAVDLEGPLQNGKDQAIIKVGEGNKDLRECIQWIQQPGVNKDAFEMIDRITRLFEQRTGLNELLYGMNVGGIQSRSATDSKIKNENAQTRVGAMAKAVESWMAEAADMEKFVLRFKVEGKDIRERVGPVGAHLWDTKVLEEPLEVVCREMRATVTAGSMRKPDKAQDAQNIASVVSTIFPELSKHADVTGDTNPVNSFIQTWGEAIEQDVDGLMMGQRQQAPPSEEAQQQQQMMLQFEQQKMQAEVQKAGLEVQKIQADVQIGGQKAQIEGQLSSIKLQTAAQEAQIDMQVKQADIALQTQEAELRQAEMQGKMLESQLKIEQQKASTEQATINAAKDITNAEGEVEGKEIEVVLKRLDVEEKKIDLQIKRKQLTLLDKEPNDAERSD